MKSFYFVLGGIAGLLLPTTSAGQDLHHRDKPANVILLLADDLGYGELGCQGNTEIPTPNIDRLASTGVRCTQAYVTAPNCSPSRAGLLTGRTPTRFGYEFNPVGARNEDIGTGLPTNQTTIAEHLQLAGYTSGLIGKWHLGGTADFHPLRHGFDTFFGFLHEGHYYLPPPWTNATTMLRRSHLSLGNKDQQWVSDSLLYSTHTGRNEPTYDANNPVLRNGQPVIEESYMTDAIAREAVDFIAQNRATPFFLCVAFNAVHSPLQAKAETLAKFSHLKGIQRQIFAAMLSDLDAAVGTIVSEVDQQSLRDDTLIIFLSDNGGPTKELTSSNLPLRGGKGSMYEGGLRVPFIVNWPSKLKGGEVNDKIVSSLDIFSTIEAVSGVPHSSAAEGQNLIALLNQTQAVSKHQQLYWRQGNRTALRQGDWKLVDSRYSSGGQRVWELFDLANDMTESTDLSASEPERLQQLIQAWSQINSQMATPLFDPP